MDAAENDRQRRRRFSCIRVALYVVAVTAAAALTGLSDGIDASILAAVHAWSSPERTQFFTSVTRFGSYEAIYGMAAVVAAVLLLLGHRPVAIRLGVVMAAAFVLNNFVKFVVARPRPEPFFGEAPSSYSFASGHALFSGCFYGFIGLLVASSLPDAWQRAVILVPTAGLIGSIGLSRVYLGVHYPTDVIAGFALAAVVLCAMRPDAPKA
ncbi:MAG: phosphatase PAP2 family protein [Hyphomicrobium sp.]